MHASLSLVAMFVTSALAQSLPCDVDNDNCRAVMDSTACFNEYMAGNGNKNSVLNCLVGTDGSATPAGKVRETNRK